MNIIETQPAEYFYENKGVECEYFKESPLTLNQLGGGLEKIKSNNPRAIIEAAAKILYLKIINDKITKHDTSSYNYRNYFHLFSEDFYLTPDSNYEDLKKEQSVGDISDFIEAVFERCEAKADYAIIVLIYIKNFLEKTELQLDNSNLRTLIFVTMLVAQKYHEDISITNKNFVEIYPFYTNKDLNRLEITFCLLMDFQFHIKNNEFSKCCLSLEEHIFTSNIYNRLGFFQEGNSVNSVPITRKISKSSTIVNLYRT